MQCMHVQVRIVEEANSVLAALASAAFLQQADDFVEAADAEYASFLNHLSIYCKMLVFCEGWSVFC